MASNISIKLKKDEVYIELNEECNLLDIYKELKEKIIDLQKFYKQDTTPIIVTGRELEPHDFEKAKEIIIEKISTVVKYEKPKTMGLHSIKGVYEQDCSNTTARFFKGSVRSGQKLSHVGSLVILGDVNSGAEVIASENVIVTGILRGIAHAGAKGNKKAFISAYSIESPQLRIANVVTGFEKASSDVNPKIKYAYIDKNKISLE